MKQLLLLLICGALAGCSMNHSHASISRVFPNGKERINLELWKATSEWQFGHGGFGNIVEYYGFAIPSYPDKRKTFDAAEITVMEINSRQANIGAIISGEIVVDPFRHEVSVSLKTNSGAFPGNGEYPL